ncbi:MAG: recombinase family protein [Candidatus Dormibacteraeota bacterium]|nr:recombinase family protein [Candidatus Dormibacteraeota bacterium]
MTQCALWLRVSTSEQETTNQEPELLALAAARGFEVAEIYRLEGESAWSGSGGYRKALDAMLRDARRGRFEVLLVWALDRLSREGPLATLQLVDRLGRAGVQVVSLHEAWTEAGGELRELLLAITAWAARMESQRRSERTKAGLERARAEGKRIGRPLGAKDSRKRRRSGYLLRWARERDAG